MTPAFWPFSGRPVRVRYAMAALLLALVIVGPILLSSTSLAVLVFGWPYVVLTGAVIVIVLHLRYGSGGRWALACLFAPVIVLLSLPATGRLRPYGRLAVHFSSYMDDVREQGTGHPRYATWDWTDQGGFAPSQIWLVYDETDRVAGPPAGKGWHGAEGPRGLCAGRSRHLYGHFYVCS